MCFSGSIKCLLSEVDISIVLTCGQSFRWRNISNKWIGPFGGFVWELQQSENCVDYTVYRPQKNASMDKSITGNKKRKFAESSNVDRIDGYNYDEMLKEYLQLNVSLKPLYEDWCSRDTNFAGIAPHVVGVRILRQDPTEALFAFICSSNNNIDRISSMVEKLCCNYGIFIAKVGDVDYYTFPTIDALSSANGLEANLRKLGFGYRAKYIADTASRLEKLGGADALLGLRKNSYEDAMKFLTDLPGVGMKVADCVCLMALDKPEAVPIDTHMRQIVCSKYLPHLRDKAVNDKRYREITDFFRGRFGPFAGWAHSVLFSSRLKRFAHLIPKA